MPTKNDLMQRQALPLNAKVLMSQHRIREWYEHWEGNVFISYSGGKDSTVLASLVHDIYPDVPLVFSNTGLEFPEIQAFARKMGATFVRPKMSFSDVISKYGYPIISKEVAETICLARHIKNGTKGKRANDGVPRTNKDGTWLNSRRKELHGIPPFDKGFYKRVKWLPLARDTEFKISHYCCNVMKKDPLKKYAKESGLYPIIGTLTDESLMREREWFRSGCNAFEGNNKSSKPMSFWKEQDVLRYIKENEIEICPIYGGIVESETDKDGFSYDTIVPGCGKLQCEGCHRTGCIYCGFGFHLEKGETRFQQLAKTHPKQYEYCLRGGQWVDNPEYDPVAPKMDDFWQNWNPKKIWVPSKEGLGMKKVFDDCNAIYGKDFMRYE